MTITDYKLSTRPICSHVLKQDFNLILLGGGTLELHEEVEVYNLETLLPPCIQTEVLECL